MNLDQAIKNLVAQEGLEILANPLLVNHLMDLRAFESMPSSKYILKMMCSEGTLNKLLDMYITDDCSEKFLHQTASTIINKWGFQREAVEQTMSSLAAVFDCPYTSGNIQQPHKATQVLQTGEHFCFRNIEIGGSMENVVSQLEQLGYDVNYVEPKVACLKGGFAAEDNCEILVCFSDIIKEVYSIVVGMPDQTTWRDLRSCYDNFKKRLTTKYGVPSSVEEFESPYYEGDGCEINAFLKGKATCFSIFELGKGCIWLSIYRNKVVIEYQDRINYNLIEKKKEETAYSDL